ncbi:hypothetical protein [Paractinoplanes toevensis]|uniref:Uncharacterized protein n=1 Tax=Paractinoplanes toevensis TaxID=571911 RepID=A0A920BQ11_9ACTN|nr:hypothetical protein [Actinoplanes toevensis]GIM96884.1 hypothetical protein Ato02nite_086770 [Actinoplanes toevensis]
MPRSRPHESGDDPPDDGAGPPRPHPAAGGDAGSVARAQAWTFAAAQRGRIGESAGRGNPETTAPAPPRSGDDIELSRWENGYDNLGDEPTKFNIAANDAAHEADSAHTIDRHGPQIPLERDLSKKTIEGRIYNDTGWPNSQNGSFRWIDPSTMNRTINDYVEKNWERIRTNLAINGQHRDVFDAGHAVGEGYVNPGMYGAGPRQSQYSVTSTVRILIELAPGTDPPQPFIVTAFPTGLG